MLLIFFGEDEGIDALGGIEHVEDGLCVELELFGGDLGASAVHEGELEQIIISIMVGISEEVLTDDVDIGYSAYPLVHLVFILGAIVDIAPGMSALEKEISDPLVLEGPRVSGIGIFMEFIDEDCTIVELVGELYHILSVEPAP